MKTHAHPPEKMYFLWSFVLFLLGLAPQLVAQEQISGIVNTYTVVAGVGTCPGSIIVEDPTGFAIGQRVLLLGMKGGNMQSDNDAGFGLVELGGLTAGLYDWSEIENIDGFEITLAHALSPGYDFGESVQLIGVPTYEDAVVTGTLLPQPWDGRTGGVIALEVTGTLTLEADIHADGLGFRGGRAQSVDSDCTFLSNISDYSYEAGNWRGAAKGEGIIPFISGKEHGRGAQANGGGGGNDHNTGGGGGSNTAAGGQGGQNREPSAFGCDGNSPGLGGRDLDAFTLRWFMGGGGGAGHKNNEQGDSHGGSGGGIIVVKCNELSFAGGSIRADGIPGSRGAGDGGGGGGGGGTIVLEVTTINGAPTVSARGGNGGDADNINQDRCYGPGGGGGGGQVYSTVAIQPDLSGGTSGRSIRSGECPDATNGATNGATGSFLAIGIQSPPDKEQVALQLFSSDMLICPGGAFELLAGIDGGDSLELAYQWAINTGTGWVALSDGPQYAGTDSLLLEVNFLEQSADFQLQVSGPCNVSAVSEPVRVEIDPAGAIPEAAFTYQANELEVVVSNSSSGAATYHWEIAEWPEFESSTAAPTINFPAAGAYQLTLYAYSNCSVDSLTQLITLGGAPVALFSGAATGGTCVPVSIQWMSESEGQFDTYEWEFPGGTPATSNEPNPTVIYYDEGIYDVRLTVSGPLGESTLTRTEIVKVFSVPQPAFAYEINDQTVTFYASTDTLTQYSWTFGDGNSSRDANPVHTYPEAGAYDVTLNVLNGSCAQSITQTILVFPSALLNNSLPVDISWYPNPTSGIVQMDSAPVDLFPMELLLFSGDGRLIRQFQLTRPAAVDLGPYPAGMYWLLMDSPLGKGSWKLRKE